MEHFECHNLYDTFFPFWKDLDPHSKALLCTNTHAVSYKRGTLVHDGNNCTGVIVVKTGCLRVYLMPEQGREITLYRLFPGDICMLSASCVLQSITFDVAGSAEEDSSCYLVNGKTFAEVRVDRTIHDHYVFADFEIAVMRYIFTVGILYADFLAVNRLPFYRRFLRSLVSKKHVEDFKVGVVDGKPSVHRCGNKVCKVQFLSAVAAIQIAFRLTIVAHTHVEVIFVTDHQILAVGVFDNAFFYLLDKFRTHFGIAVTKLRVRFVVPILMLAVDAVRQETVQLVTAASQIARARSRMRKRYPVS